jgi:aspartate carbamoyltransferase catalytic subunit
MKREKGTIDGLTIGLVGDLRYGRTVHSLAYALAQYNVKLHLISPDQLRMRRDILVEVEKKIHVKESTDLTNLLADLDVIYMTRIQKERFPDLAEYEKVKGSYRLDAAELASAKADAIVMHPLPRVDEISPDVDATAHSKYFKQVWYGLLTRMTLISLVLGGLK